MIPFVIKTRFDQVWLWRPTEIYKLECIFTCMPNQNKWWDRTYSTICLVFGDVPFPKRLRKNVRWKLFNSDFEKGLL